MPDTGEDKQTGNHEAKGDQGCPVGMRAWRRCGRPIYNAPPGIDKTPVCLMHSRDPNKDDGAFRAEFERILKEAGEGVADFAYFVFPSASYRSRKFAAMCSFEGATFTQAADFSAATFTQHAFFREATFTQAADFAGATFAQEAAFDGATFTKGADFSAATFTQDANFRRARFTQDADFRGAKFAQDVYFSRATLTQVADFSFPEFMRAAEFRETIFRNDSGRDPGLVFTRTRFEKPEAVEFADVDLGQALFYRGDVSKLGFSNVRWRRRENGKWMLFEEVANLEHPSARSGLRPEKAAPDDRNYVVIAELYQQLKKGYDDRRDYWTAGDFHYGEMEMKRLACPRLTWLPWLEAKLSGKPLLSKLGAWCGKLQSSPWLLSKLRWWHQWFGLAAWYRRFSDYGESWGKPLLWLFAVLAIFAALYPLLGLRPVAGKSPAAKATSVQVKTPSLQETDLRYWNYERPGRLFWHSVMTSLGVAAFQRDLAYEPSYPWGRLFALFELLHTSTLIALFLLAVRRQFRR
jgi:uncharacterized protein YjbI with pentapeptide repeats